MKRVSLLRYLLVIVSVISPLTLLSGSVTAHALTPGTCTDVQLPVALATGQAADQTISGTLCVPLIWYGTPTVDVLVHGFSYNRSYWDFPIETNRYSYVDDTLLAGRATFAYDQIGAGKSSHPLSSTITIQAQAFILHQVLDWLKARQSFAAFDVVGHSLGSVTALVEAATYNDETRLVLTAFTHITNPANSVALMQDTYPANQDPQFASKNLDPGYLTTVPGTRGQLFYSAIAEPTIIAYDETHKDTSTGAVEISSLPLFQAPAATGISSHITVPVFNIVGQQDTVFACNPASPTLCTSDAALQNSEGPFYPRARSFTAKTVPFTGHDLALHPTNLLTFGLIEEWISTH